MFQHVMGLRSWQSNLASVGKIMSSEIPQIVIVIEKHIYRSEHCTAVLTKLKSFASDGLG